MTRIAWLPEALSVAVLVSLIYQAAGVI